MPTIDKTMDHGTLKRLVGAGAQVGADVVGSSGGWSVVINYGRVSQTLAATRGAPRTWRQFETLAHYLKALGIVEYRVNAAKFDSVAPATRASERRSITASARMKHAHKAAAYDTWFREQVQASIDDPRPSLTNDQARAQMASRRHALLKKAVAKPGAGKPAGKSAR